MMQAPSIDMTMVKFIVTKYIGVNGGAEDSDSD
jgi:hypothetical protein